MRASRSPYANGAAEPHSFEWELRFAQAGVAGIISACPAACPADGLMPEIIRDEVMARWQEHVGRIHAFRCKYIVRLDLARAPSVRLEESDLRSIAASFVEAARRVREMGADGVEIDAMVGSLVAQYLAPGVNDRPARYQGSLENRARLALEIVRAVRRDVSDLHLQVKLSVSSPLGMMTAGVPHLVKWLEKEGADAIHLAVDADHQVGMSGGPGEMASRYVKDATRLPVLRAGWFGSVEDIGDALGGACDAVVLVRPWELPPRNARTCPRPAA